MEKETFKALLKKYEDGQCTPQEIAYVESWFLNVFKEAPSLDAMPNYDAIDADLRHRLELPHLANELSEVSLVPKRPLKISLVFRYAVTILVFLAVGIGIYWYASDREPNQQLSSQYGDDVLPGGSRATLTFPDGSVVELSESQEGIIISDEDVTYNDGTSLALSPVGGGREGLSDGRVRLENIEILALTTPNGGQYQVTLPDGSKVWLNAESTLKYPSRFSDAERIVHLIGEAYFEVSKIELSPAGGGKGRLPFKVVTNNQIVEVLGTQFNITAYPDESETKTTLVEGKVQVTLSPAGEPVPNSLWEGRGRSVVLQPGTQSSTSRADINIQKVDVSPYIAWKDGLFHFDGTVPQEAFGQLSRWYDLEVVYEGKRPSVRFYGMIGRDKSLASVLGILQESGLGFRIEKTGDRNKLIVVNE